VARISLAKDPLGCTDQGVVLGNRDLIDELEQRLIALFLDGLFDLSLHFRGGRIATF